MEALNRFLIYSEFRPFLINYFHLLLMSHSITLANQLIFLIYLENLLTYYTKFWKFVVLSKFMKVTFSNLRRCLEDFNIIIKA